MSSGGATEADEDLMGGPQVGEDARRCARPPLPLWGVSFFRLMCNVSALRARVL